MKQKQKGPEVHPGRRHMAEDLAHYRKEAMVDDADARLYRLAFNRGAIAALRLALHDVPSRREPRFRGV